MQMELRIGEVTLVVEAEGAVSVRVLTDGSARHGAEQAVLLGEPAELPESTAQIEAVPCEDLFTRLVELRRELAAEAGVPPYVVFQDKALREMADMMPMDIEAFASIRGVGKTKVEKYADCFLAVIKASVA